MWANAPAPKAVKRVRLSAKALKAEAATRDGCVQLSYCRHGTGPMVGVYRSVDAGMEEDPDGRWSVVCEEHDALVCVRQRYVAMSTATDTCNFCDACREAETSAPTKEERRIAQQIERERAKKGEGEILRTTEDAERWTRRVRFAGGEVVTEMRSAGDDEWLPYKSGVGRDGLLEQAIKAILGRLGARSTRTTP